MKLMDPFRVTLLVGSSERELISTKLLRNVSWSRNGFHALERLCVSRPVATFQGLVGQKNL